MAVLGTRQGIGAGMSLLLVVCAAAVSCSKHSNQAQDRTGSGARVDPDHEFWAWFSDHAAALSKAPLMDVMNQVQVELDKAHHGVDAEVGTAGDDRLLVLTADGDRAMFPAVQQLFAARPTIKGWKIVAFRQRDAEQQMPTIEMNGSKLARAAVRYVAQRDQDKLDVQLFIPGYEEGNKTLGSMAFLALDHTIGEYDVETKIGVIDLLPIERAPATARPLADLPAEVDALGSGR